MRRVRYSSTFVDQLNTLLAHGEPKFGSRVIDEKRDRVFDIIDHHLTLFPNNTRDPDLNLCAYSISKTPFVVIYDFDEIELRIFFIVHSRSDRSRIDPNEVIW